MALTKLTKVSGQVLDAEGIDGGKLTTWIASDLVEGQTTLSPPYTFTTAILNINGVTQTPSVAFSISNNKIVLTEALMADPLTGDMPEVMAYLSNITLNPDYVLKQDIVSSTGYSLIGQISSINDLRSVIPTSNLQKVLLRGYYNNSTQGGGEFYYDSTDTSSIDDGGYVIVTTLGHRWKRIPATINEINLIDYGLQTGGLLDAPLVSAWNKAVELGITNITIPKSTQTNPFILNGGITLIVPVAGMVIRGDSGTFNGTNISHTGDNTGITFERGTSANLFSRVRLEYLRVIGNSGINANFVEFQDTWRCGATTVWGSLYTFGALFVLHNRTMWTENPSFIDIMSRSNKYGIKLKRTSATGGTDSFYGLEVQMSHQFAVANSSALAMPSLTDATNTCVIYSANIDIMGWYEAQGGHQAILVGDFNSLLDSMVTIRTDGTGGITNGTDMRAINASGSNSLCDIYMRCLFQQGDYTDLSSVTSGSNIGGFAQALSCFNLYTTVEGRNKVRARGARYKWTLSSNADKTFNVTNLPCYSSFRAILTTKGSNMETSHTYNINTHGINNIAEVIAINTYSGTGWSNFKLKPFNGATGGSFSTNNGGKISWDHLANTYGSTVEVTLEIEML